MLLVDSCKAGPYIALVSLTFGPNLLVLLPMLVEQYSSSERPCRFSAAISLSCCTCGQLQIPTRAGAAPDRSCRPSILPKRERVMSSRRSVSDSRNADWSRRTSRAGSPASANGHREHHRDKCKRVTKRKPPQKSIEQFWSRFTTTTPGKAFTILPDNLYAKRLAVHKREQENSPEHAVRSYEEAKKLCISKVDKIVKECRRVNQKYRDPHFDIESDFFSRGRPDCLMGLDDHECVFRPGSVKRVDKIFKNPRFFIRSARSIERRF